MNTEKYFNDIASGVENSVMHFDESKIFNPNVKQEILTNSLINPPILKIDKIEIEVDEKSIKTENAVPGLKPFEDKYDSVTFTVPVMGNYVLLVKLLEEVFTPRKDLYMSGTGSVLFFSIQLHALSISSLLFIFQEGIVLRYILSSNRK